MTRGSMNKPCSWFSRDVVSPNHYWAFPVIYWVKIAAQKTGFNDYLKYMSKNPFFYLFCTDLQFSNKEPGKVFLTKSFTLHFDSSVETSSNATTTKSFLDSSFKTLPNLNLVSLGVDSFSVGCTSTTAYVSSEFTATAET